MPKYNTVDNIPAKVFFDILKTKNFKLLQPKWFERKYEDVFKAIYDDFFLKSDNDEAKEYLRLHNEIVFLEYKIITLKQCVLFYYANKTTKKMREDFISGLKEGFGIEIDTTVDFVFEVQRVLNIEIGIIENDLSLAKIDYDNMIKQSKQKDFDYYEHIGVLSHTLPNNSLLKEEMTLATYISLEKLAKKLVSQQSKNKVA